MDNEKTLKEMVEIINEFGQCTLYLADDDEICICPATDFIGGEEGHYMCDVLGNIQYDNVETICRDVLEYMEDREIDSVEVD